MNKLTPQEQKLFDYLHSLSPLRPTRRQIAAHLWPDETYEPYKHGRRIVTIANHARQKGVHIAGERWRGYQIIEHDRSAA